MQLHLNHFEICLNGFQSNVNTILFAVVAKKYEIMANRIAGKSASAGDLPDREFIAEIPTSDLAQNGHVNHS